MTRPQTPQPGHEIADQQICILWHAQGKTPSDALLGALSNKGMRVTLADNEHTVFAVACRCDGVAKRTVIVLDARESLSGVDRVLSALRRFAPGVICWAYQDGANPPMIPVVQPVRDPAPKVQPREAQTPRATATRPGPLRLVGEGEALRPMAKPGGTRSDGSLNARDVLDADELDALLAGEMGERPRER